MARRLKSPRLCDCRSGVAESLPNELTASLSHVSDPYFDTKRWKSEDSKPAAADPATVASAVNPVP
jgi:hypothetical protein